MALNYAHIIVEQHEVDLKNKPMGLINASTKGTVPVLVLATGKVLDESLAIMKWALQQSDPDGWWQTELEATCDELIQMNDKQFKPLLDQYKYPKRSEAKDPVYYRAKAEAYLEQLNYSLMKTPYLVTHRITYADVAVFPFIRQFYMVDKQWFATSEYPFLKRWLDYFLNSDLFLHVFKKTTMTTNS
jgi:glutathione S-transferase